MTEAEAARFDAKVKRTATCWLWEAGRFTNGYGAFRLRGRLERAHRVAWEHAHGRPIPEGMVVLHLCDRRRCVRPDHLRVGTHAANAADRVAKGRSASGARNGAATHAPRLTPAAVRAIRARHAEGASQRAIGVEFGVDQTMVSRIVRGVAWAWVT